MKDLKQRVSGHDRPEKTRDCRDLTPGQRFLIALNNGVADRVPVAPDMSNYIPAKRTNLPFWDIYFYGRATLWESYLEACDYFGCEAWIASNAAPPLTWENPNVDVKQFDRYDRTLDLMVRREEIRTPDGTLTREVTCPRFDPPTPTEKPLKNLEKDFAAWRHLLVSPSGINQEQVEGIRAACQRRGQALGFHVGYPGFQVWNEHVVDGVAQLAYASVDNPGILDEWFERDLEIGTKVMELTLSARPDYLLFGGSGTITLASPELARRYALPALQRWSRMAADQGVPTMLHSCGKSRALVDMLAESTAVGMINPLEIAPMGDVDLAEVKRVRGRQIGLMGNLHTTKVMLLGTPQQVKAAARQAIIDAGVGGGFILSTGDQCGRDTPEANLFAMVEAAREFGVYDRSGGLPNLGLPGVMPQ